MRILVVEDNLAMADGISTTLRNMGASVDVSHDGNEADEILKIQNFDLVVLDLNLPNLDGLEILRNLRHRQNKSQVLILTARGQLEDRVKGLDLGADDYLAKPFELLELEARVRALLRRLNDNRSPVIQIGRVAFDTVARTISIDGEIIELPKREFSLLEIFITRIGKVLSKEQIADGLANFDDYITPNAVEIYISRLRKKLKGTGLKIKTIRGLGYLMESI